MTRIDETNLQILHLLQRNGRATVAELARAVGRAETTVRERILAMEMDGVIQGYEAHVDPALAGLPDVAVLRARCPLGKLPELARQLAALPEVTRVLHVTGRRPVLVVLRVRDTAHLEALLRGRLAQTLLQDVEAQLGLEELVPLRQPGLVGPPSATPGFAVKNGARGAPVMAHA